MRSTSADSFALAVSTEGVRSAVRSKLPSRVRGVQQPIREPLAARGRDRDNASLGRRRRALSTPMSNRTRQMLGRMR